MLFFFYFVFLQILVITVSAVKNDPRSSLINPISSSKSLPTPRPVRIAIFALPPLQLLHKYSPLGHFQLTHLEIIVGEYMIGLREKKGGIEILLNPWQPQNWLKGKALEHELYYQLEKGYLTTDKVEYIHALPKRKIENIGLATVQQIQDLGCTTNMPYTKIVERIEKKFDGKFHVFRNNCVHFGMFLYEMLCGEKIPSRFTRPVEITRNMFGTLYTGRKVDINEYSQDN